MENENENLLNRIDFPMYDGMGNPRNHLKAYLDSLAGMEKGNKLKMRLFVRTLTGPTLMCQVPPHGQATAGPRFIAPNLSFFASAASTYDIEDKAPRMISLRKVVRLMVGPR
ncbi:hypothetical protein HAX54_053023 [Datura stramonium]|uniref:Uncharacterized protein n=1 Tax=Datura stramonium TaxID=4076 RepID=A0ABS8WRG2_DATST|nr:hypothetical protein [Datura stramonium]